MGNNERKHEAQETWRSFYKKQSTLNFIPKDPYSHQASLLYPHNLSVDEFGDLLNQHLLLGVEEDPAMLSYYQEEMYFITSIFAMSKQDPELLQDLFNIVYYPFVIGIRMTCILDGSERKMQGFTYKETARRRSMSDKIMGRKKKTKTPEVEDIILPQEYWE